MQEFQNNFTTYTYTIKDGLPDLASQKSFMQKT